MAGKQTALWTSPVDNGKINTILTMKIIVGKMYCFI